MFFEIIKNGNSTFIQYEGRNFFEVDLDIEGRLPEFFDLISQQDLRFLIFDWQDITAIGTKYA